MSRSTKISASILVGAIGWLVAVGELLALSLSCERLQTGDVFVRLVTAMVTMAVLSAWPLDLVIIGAIVWLSIVDAPVTLSL
jgi:hypothetical protein